jgi:hypothetical protein
MATGFGCGARRRSGRAGIGQRADPGDVGGFGGEGGLKAMNSTSMCSVKGKEVEIYPI